jgi:hypothetical protein
MTKKRRILLYVIFLLFAGNAWSQTKALNADSLRAKLALYSKIHPSEVLFVHTDKTLYTNNESLWFSAYLIKNALGKMHDHNILSVSLMREDDRKIFFEQQHVIKEGLSAGSVVIPNNIPPGNYQFNACTNVLDQNGRPVVTFSQPITIKSISQTRFNASLALLDTAIANGAVRASVSLTIKDYERAGKPVIIYGVGGGKTQKITLKDEESSANISIPAAQLTGTEPVLLTEVSYNYDTLYLSVKLPKAQTKELNIRFFPEGGNLTEGIESVVALETFTTDGLPVSLSGSLCSNDKVVSTVSSNSYGVARFRLKPEAGGHYTFRIRANNYLDRDSVYKLPDALNNGVVLRLGDAVVNDTLAMTVYSKVAAKFKVLIHNYREDFALLDIEANADGKKLSLPVSALPKGIATVTVIDEESRPVAERLFFAHYDQKISAVIKTEKEIYNKRDSVQASVSLTDKDGKPLQGLLSIAAVQESRIEGDKETDIESYFYLNHDLGLLPRDPQGRGFNNKSFLEDMFLTRGWRRYTWQGLVQSKVADTLRIGPPPEFKGYLLHRGKPLKDTIRLLVLRNKNFDKVMTAPDGSFTLNRHLLEIAEGSKVNVWTDLLEQKNYAIQLNNPFKPINRQVADAAVLKNWGIAGGIESSMDQQLKDMQKNIVLNEVNIKGVKNNGPMYGLRNECGDYVCQAGYLNCFYHTPSNSKVYAPVKGQAIVGGVYQGCTSTGQEVLAIYTGREFYGLNRSADGQLETQYLSTLFWKPSVTTNQNGEAAFCFYTGDITGKFRIIVQGMSGKSVVYGDGEIMVK